MAPSARSSPSCLSFQINSSKMLVGLLHSCTIVLFGLSACQGPSTPLKLLCIDVWGPTPYISCLGFKYYVLVVDHYMHYTWFFPMKLKSDVFHIFNSFLPYLECFFNRKLLILQTDGGGKFKSLTSICKKI